MLSLAFFRKFPRLNFRQTVTRFQNWEQKVSLLGELWDNILLAQRLLAFYELSQTIISSSQLRHQFHMVLGLFFKQKHPLLRQTIVEIESSSSVVKTIHCNILVLEGPFNYYQYREKLTTISPSKIISDGMMFGIDKKHRQLYWIDDDSVLSMDTTPITDQFHEVRIIDRIRLSSPPLRTTQKDLPDDFLQWVLYTLVSELLLEWFVEITRIQKILTVEPEWEDYITHKLEKRLYPLSLNEFIGALLHKLSTSVNEFTRIFADYPEMAYTMDHLHFRDLDDALLRLNNIDLRNVIAPNHFEEDPK